MCCKNRTTIHGFIQHCCGKHWLTKQLCAAWIIAERKVLGAMNMFLPIVSSLESEELDYEAMRQKLTSSNTSLRNQFIVSRVATGATGTTQSAPIPNIKLGLWGQSLDQQNALFRPTTGWHCIRSTALLAAWMMTSINGRVVHNFINI